MFIWLANYIFLDKDERSWFAETETTISSTTGF